MMGPAQTALLGSAWRKLVDNMKLLKDSLEVTGLVPCSLWMEAVQLHGLGLYPWVSEPCYYSMRMSFLSLCFLIVK